MNIKVIEQKRLRTTEQNLQILEKLIHDSELIRPYRKKKGIVLKFKTWDDLYEFTITRPVREI